MHVASPEGEAKFWLAPRVELAMQYGLSPHKLNEIKRIIERDRDEIRSAWRDHFTH